MPKTTRSGVRVKRADIKGAQGQLDTLYERLTAALDATDEAARRAERLNAVSRDGMRQRFPSAGGGAS